MRTKVVMMMLVVGVVLAGTLAFSAAQQPQIPTLQASNQTAAKGKATVQIASRKDAIHKGFFTVSLEMSFNPAAADYPAFTGPPPQIAVDLSDSVKGTVLLADIDQATSTGKHTPTVYLSGRCKIDVPGARPITGCRYWLLIADNKRAEDRGGTPDVISFLVFDKAGKRMAYGSGPVLDGDIDVADTSN